MFKKAVDLMIEDGYLFPDANVIAEFEAKKDKLKNDKTKQKPALD